MALTPPTRQPIVFDMIGYKSLNQYRGPFAIVESGTDIEVRGGFVYFVNDNQFLTATTIPLGSTPAGEYHVVMYLQEDLDSQSFIRDLILIPDEGDNTFDRETAPNMNLEGVYDLGMIKIDATDGLVAIDQWWYGDIFHCRDQYDGPFAVLFDYDVSVGDDAMEPSRAYVGQGYVRLTQSNGSIDRVITPTTISISGLSNDRIIYCIVDIQKFIDNDPWYYIVNAPDAIDLGTAKNGYAKIPLAYADLSTHRSTQIQRGDIWLDAWLNTVRAKDNENFRGYVTTVPQVNETTGDVIISSATLHITGGMFREHTLASQTFVDTTEADFGFNYDPDANTVTAIIRDPASSAGATEDTIILLHYDHTDYSIDQYVIGNIMPGFSNNGSTSNFEAILSGTTITVKGGSIFWLSGDEFSFTEQSFAKPVGNTEYGIERDADYEPTGNIKENPGGTDPIIIATYDSTSDAMVQEIIGDIYEDNGKVKCEGPDTADWLPAKIIATDNANLSLIKTYAPNDFTVKILGIDVSGVGTSVIKGISGDGDNIVFRGVTSPYAYSIIKGLDGGSDAIEFRGMNNAGTADQNVVKGISGDNQVIEFRGMKAKNDAKNIIEVTTSGDNIEFYAEIDLNIENVGDGVEFWKGWNATTEVNEIRTLDDSDNAVEVEAVSLIASQETDEIWLNKLYSDQSADYHLIQGITNDQIVFRGMGNAAGATNVLVRGYATGDEQIDIYGLDTASTTGFDLIKGVDGSDANIQLYGIREADDPVAPSPANIIVITQTGEDIEFYVPDGLTNVANLGDAYEVYKGWNATLSQHEFRTLEFTDPLKGKGIIESQDGEEIFFYVFNTTDSATYDMADLASIDVDVFTFKGLVDLADGSSDPSAIGILKQENGDNNIEVYGLCRTGSAGIPILNGASASGECIEFADVVDVSTGSSLVDQSVAGDVEILGIADGSAVTDSLIKGVNIGGTDCEFYGLNDIATGYHIYAGLNGDNYEFRGIIDASTGYNIVKGLNGGSTDIEIIGIDDAASVTNSLIKGFNVGSTDLEFYGLIGGSNGIEIFTGLDGDDYKFRGIKAHATDPYINVTSDTDDVILQVPYDTVTVIVGASISGTSIVFTTKTLRVIDDRGAGSNIVLTGTECP